jgi:hypothetical protein
MKLEHAGNWSVKSRKGRGITFPFILGTKFLVDSKKIPITDGT